MNTLAWWSKLRKVVHEAHRVRGEHFELDEALRELETFEEIGRLEQQFRQELPEQATR
jgi:hypothetical protein